MKFNPIIGIDEAGRGPLAGPVVVAGVRLESRTLNQESRIFAGIKDSKKLSPKKREEWFRVLTSHPDISWVVAKVWPKKIDQINIAKATNLGALRVYRKLASEGSCAALLDGSLYLPREIVSKTIIKGDEKIPAISAASIIAKVTRDRTMVRLHKKFPQYRFDVHKGYGTRLHRQLIGQYGYSKIHRKSFRAAIELA